MRRILLALAAATALTMALSIGAGFAAERTNATPNSGSSIENHCASILAEREVHSKAEVHACEVQQ